MKQLMIMFTLTVAITYYCFAAIQESVRMNARIKQEQQVIQVMQKLGVFEPECATNHTCKKGKR